MPKKSKTKSRAAATAAKPAVSSAADSAAAVTQLLERLRAVALDLRWSWHPPAQQLFTSIDPAHSDALKRNPIALLSQAPAHRLERLARDADFLARLTAVETERKAYHRQKPWFNASHSARERKLRVAYFCAEFALHESLPIYSGGLGVLAGDHLKAASDLGIPLCAVGLLYRFGYYRQEIHADGTTGVHYIPQDFNQLPITDTGHTIRVPMGARKVKAKIWRADVGRVPLYLLDTDHDGNRHPDDRAITHHLYGGDSELRIRQEILLGVGGVRALKAVDESFTVLHLNEGHAAFAPLEVALDLVRDESIPYAYTVDRVRPHTVFTTHTPVPAGHDRFDQALASQYLKPLLAEARLKKPNDLAATLRFGFEDGSLKDEPVCMTAMAMTFSGRVNGVAKLHGAVTRSMWQDLYGNESVDEVPIGSVTNGVHPTTWLAPEAHALYQKRLKPDWHRVTPETDWWSKVDQIPTEELWAMRSMLRQRLVRFARNHLQHRALRQGHDAAALGDVSTLLNENALTIGFARRFATYKRAPLIFTDMQRLAKIVGNDERPVQFLFAGKAHPKDLGGQAYLQKVVKLSRHASFKGRIVVLEDYDMQIGRKLTSGCDIWLNNPLRPNEASGTSGMKPPLHGGVNLSILDGWWPEGYQSGERSGIYRGRKNGYAIGDGRECSSARSQDQYDAGCIYDLLEKEIVPAFYTRGRDGIPKQWAKFMAESMKSIPAAFSTWRMLGDYTRDCYLPAHHG